MSCTQAPLMRDVFAWELCKNDSSNPEGILAPFPNIVTSLLLSSDQNAIAEWFHTMTSRFNALHFNSPAFFFPLDVSNVGP